MINAKLRLKSLALALLALGAAGAVSAARAAEPAYPPGWNVKKEPPAPMFHFIPGSWNDTKVYWSDQTRPGNNPSRPVASGPILYQFVPGGDHPRYIHPDQAKGS
jgi:hypothetical protein